MLIRDIEQAILFKPLENDVNELYIISGYATPNMLSWYIKNLGGKTRTPIKIHLLIGMIPYDGISVGAHEGFIQLIHDEKPKEVDQVECSYLFDMPAVNSNIYIWAKDGNPTAAFAGSAHFTQNAFVGNRRQEVMLSCVADEAMREYESLIGRSIYINHAEIEEYITIHPTHPVFDRENNLVEGVDALERQGYPVVHLSLVTRTGEPGRRSGLNWGQRPNRNPNEAYIPLPAQIARKGFFPLEGERHFTVITDDRRQLILRVEQQNDKAITTPARNSDLGEYFRNRLGLANGGFVDRAALDAYGRTDVAFVKLDEETYYMDFSV